LEALRSAPGEMISQVYVSSSLRRFDEKIKQEYGLLSYHSRHLPTIFFGCYNSSDYRKIKQHRNMPIIMWGGTDCNTIKDKKDVNTRDLFGKRYYHLAISQQIYDKLLEYGVSSDRIYLIKLRLLNYNDYSNAVESKGDSVYIYTAVNDERARDVYGKDIYDQVIKAMPDTNFIVAYG